MMREKTMESVQIDVLRAAERERPGGTLTSALATYDRLADWGFAPLIFLERKESGRAKILITVPTPN